MNGKTKFKKKVFKKKKVYKRKVRRSIPNYSLGNQKVVPDNMFKKFVSHASCYINAGGAVALPWTFDVALNDLHQPWAQTLAYNTTNFTASMGTPTPATNGFEGLASWLGSTKLYNNYRVHGANFEIRIESHNSLDAGCMAILPWKSFRSVSYTPSATFNGAVSDPQVKCRDWNDDKVTSFSKYYKIHEIFGQTNKEYNIDDYSVGLAGATPTNVAYLRCMFATYNDNVMTTSARVNMVLTVYAQLINPTVSPAETVV